MKKPAKDPRSPYVVVAEDLRHAIRSGRYQPGDKIPSIAQLAEEYDVVASTIQASLRVLKSEGILEGRQGAGTFVADTQANLVDALADAMRDPDHHFTFTGFVDPTELRVMLDAIHNHAKLRSE